MFKIQILIFFGMLLGALSCNFINPQEPLPTYIKVDSIKLVDNNNAILRSNFTNAWVYLQDSKEIRLLGTFQLPFVIPAIVTENAQLIITPGVYIDGMVSTAGAHPFYAQSFISMEPKPLDTLDLKTITTTYLSNFNTLLFEDLESGRSFGMLGPDSLANYVNNYLTPLTGNSSGILTMAVPQKECWLVNTGQMQLTNTKSYFIEFDYKSDIDMEIGVIQNQGSINSFNYLLGLKKQSSWKKIYINLTDDIKIFGNGLYKIIFRMRFLNSETIGHFELDNLKLLESK